MSKPKVLVAGDYEHGDFVDVMDALRSDADLVFEVGSGAGPELVVIAESRPGVVGRLVVATVRRAAPLTGAVTVLGAWSAGQARASRPAHDTLRLYWHEFVPWWRRQLGMRAMGRCPDWARPDCVGFQVPPAVASRPSPRGTVVISTPRWETADALADVVERAGYSTVWQRRGRDVPTARSAVAGVWEGGQLDDAEVEELAAFCRALASEGVRVVAILDFPWRDRMVSAREAGAAAVLAKPWINADLLTAIEVVVQRAAP